MPTHDEIRAAKAHIEKVDNAQEIILEAMFDELRSNYEINFSERKEPIKWKLLVMQRSLYAL